MEKPITVARQEFADGVANLVNTSNLHPLILLPVLKEVTAQVEYALDMLTKKDREEYEESLKNEETDV